MSRKIKVKTPEQFRLESLEAENAFFMLAMANNYENLQNENAQLMLKVAMLEMGGV